MSGEVKNNKVSARKWQVIAGWVIIGLAVLMYLSDAYKLNGTMRILDAGIALAAVLIAIGCCWLASVVPPLWFGRMTSTLLVVLILAVILHVVSDSPLANLAGYAAMGSGILAEDSRKKRKVEE